MPRVFTAYTVADGAVTGFRTVTADWPFTVRSTAPRTFRKSTLSNPNGTIELVRITNGQFAGTWVSPDDRGVTFIPST